MNGKDGPDVGPSNIKTVSFKALQRARTTIEDFIQSYFPYVGLHPVKDLYKYLDVLVWLEASIYQLDEENELLSRTGQAAPGRRLLAESPIAQVLEAEGLLDEATRRELAQGDVYWAGERRLCAAMLAAGAAAPDALPPGGAGSVGGADGAAEATAAKTAAGRTTGADTAPATGAAATAGAGSVGGPPAPPVQSAAGPVPGAQLAGASKPGTAHPQQGPEAPGHPHNSVSFTQGDVLAVHRAKSFDYRVLHLVLRQLVARDAAAAARDPMRVLAHGGRAVHGEAALHPQGVSLPWEGLQVGSAGQSRGEKGRGSKRGAEHVRGCEVGHAGKRSKQGPAGVLAGGEAAAEELGQTGAEESEGDHRKAGVGRRKDGQKGSCGEDGGSPEGSTAEQSEEEGDEAGDGDLVLSFLRLDELLVDIGDDLTDYEDDVEANSFNILRAYVFLFGRAAPLRLIQRISALERRHAALLARLPPALQGHYWARHRAAAAQGDGPDADDGVSAAAATAEMCREQPLSGHTEGVGQGGEGGVGGGGRWSFPPTLIFDEAAFRAGLVSSSSSSSDCSGSSSSSKSGSGDSESGGSSGSG